MAAQQAVMQNLITYITNYKNSIMQRVGELEVSSSHFVTVSILVRHVLVKTLLFT